MTERLIPLFWPRETGLAIEFDKLPLEVRDRVLALVANDSGEFVLRLPFLDRKECRRQEEILRGLTFLREGNVIRAVLGAQAAARDLAATTALTDPAWLNAPSECQPGYFPVWQSVSLALQRWLRNRVAEAYFAETARFADRPAAYPVIVYQAGRLCHGHPRTEFTYDLRDYPECDTTLEASWKMTGRSIQAVLRRIECRLLEAGMPELAHRYAPVWHHDVLVSVQKKPRPYVELLTAEAALINAVIDLGTERSVQAANRFAACVNLNLRKIGGMDLRELGTGVLEEATRVLDHLFDGGVLEDGDARAARSPDARISGEENGDDGSAYSGGKMGNSGVVSNIDARGGKPAGQIV